MTFRSQFGEDAWLFENGFIKNEGIYVDIGCAHPFECSNTSVLREFGWTGIHVDASDSWRHHWSEMGLSFVHGVVSNKERVRFLERTDSTISGVHETGTEVQAVSLAKLIDVPMFNERKIDLISIDVEGHEYEVLESVNHDDFWFSILIVEFNTLGTLNGKFLEWCILNKWYTPIHKTAANIILKHR